MTTILIHDHVTGREETIESPRSIQQIAAHLARRIERLEHNSWSCFRLHVRIDKEHNRIVLHWHTAPDRDPEFARELIEAGGIPARTSLWLLRGRRVVV